MGKVASLAAHDLYRFFHADQDETLALRGVSLSVSPGEMVAVTGPSGSGKSTLLACLAGLDEPDGGWVEIDGEKITRQSEATRALIRASKIGMLLQTANLFDHLTVTDNLMMATALTGTPRSLEVGAILEAVGIGHRAHALPSLLSGGELARAGLAIALINQPAILMADEPTGEVDAENETRIIELLKNRSRNGGATLIVTHSGEVARQADRVIRLVDGRISDD